MKKLLNKLRTKPKLYKCLKILGVVGICLSLIFNAVIIGSVIAYNSKVTSKDNEVRNVATTPIKSMQSLENKVIMMSADWTSGELLGHFVNSTGIIVDYMKTQGSSTHKFISVSGTIVQVWNKYDFRNNIPTGTKNVDYFDIHQIDLDVTGSGTGTNGAQWFYVTLTAQELDWVFKFDFMCLKRINEDYIYIEGMQDFHVEVNTDMLAHVNFIVQIDKSSGFYTQYFAETATQEYWNGYDLGYNAGYNSGYVAGSQGIESNAFTIIGQAFNGVAQIFNINVLPNLPLWVLVFTPLIIAVVIVVIKMIKG